MSKVNTLNKLNKLDKLDKGLTEDQFISTIQKKIRKSLPKNKSIICGIGDDTAVWRSITKNQLITTDTLVENIDFTLPEFLPSEVAIKSLQVNLSDIAAMGGTPEMALVTLGIPKTLSKNWLQTFYSALIDECKKYNITIVGGDITSVLSKDFWVSVVLIGNAKKIKTRSSAKAGDYLAVTKTLGNAALGLAILQSRSLKKERENTIKNNIKKYIEKQKTPRARLAEGQFLSMLSGVSAMMDLSDGLGADLSRLLKASKVAGAKIWSNNLPVEKDFNKICKLYKKNPLELAINGGEDFELLVTIKQNQLANVIKKCANKKIPLTIIGQLTHQKGIFIIDQAGTRINLTLKGFDHLAHVMIQ